MRLANAICAWETREWESNRVRGAWMRIVNENRESDSSTRITTKCLSMRILWESWLRIANENRLWDSWMRIKSWIRIATRLRLVWMRIEDQNRQSESPQHNREGQLWGRIIKSGSMRIVKENCELESRISESSIRITNKNREGESWGKIVNENHPIGVNENREWESWIRSRIRIVKQRHQDHREGEL